MPSTPWSRAGRKRRLQPAGDRRRARLARRDDPARGREISAAGRLRLQPGLHRRGAGRNPDIAALLVELFHARNDPDARCDRARGRCRGDPRAHRGGAERRAEPRRRPHHPPHAQCDRLRAAHQFLSAGENGDAQALCRHQARQPEARRIAGAPAACRNLRLLPRGRRRASALRQGGARRHPLVATGARISAPRSWAL